MGRKLQKTRKHKKLKPVDPFNFKAQDERKTKSKLNLPPTSTEQEVPRSFRDIFMKPSVHEASTSTSTKREKRLKREDKQKKRGEFVKRKWESEKQYLNRVNRETYDFVSEQIHKIKYGLDQGGKSDGDDEKSEALTKKEQKVLSQRKRSSQRGGLPVKPVKKRRKKEVDFLNVKDFIPFGERVDAPPILTVGPKKLKKIDSSSKAGTKDLLLKNLYVSSDSAVLPFPDKSAHLFDGTIKCDDSKKQKVLTEERSRVIEAYRSLKHRQKLSLV